MNHGDTGDGAPELSAASEWQKNVEAVDHKLDGRAKMGEFADPRYSEHFRNAAEIMQHWNSKEYNDNPGARRYLLDRVGREMMHVVDVPPDTVLESKMEKNHLGLHSEGEARISINEELLKDKDPRQALETYLHEYRHACQEAEMKAARTGIGDQPDPARVRDLSKPYIEPPNATTPPERQASQFEAYEAQFKESDARRAARQMSDSILNLRDVQNELATTARSPADRAVEAKFNQQRLDKDELK